MIQCGIQLDMIWTSTTLKYQLGLIIVLELENLVRTNAECIVGGLSGDCCLTGLQYTISFFPYTHFSLLGTDLDHSMKISSAQAVEPNGSELAS